MNLVKWFMREHTETYDRWLAECDDRCPICAKPFSPSRLICLDHEHTTGLVRGLCCSDCNDWLGFNHDDADKFDRAANYLKSVRFRTAGNTIYVPGSAGAAGEL